MKSISVLILLAIFLSSCHLSIDFAKRKYRPGFYVNLSSNQAISHQPLAISRSKELDKRIADLTSIPSKRESISDNYQPTIIHHQYQSQTTPIYIRSENRVFEENSLVCYKSNEQEKRGDNIDFTMGTFLVLLFALIALIILGLLALIGLVKFTLLAFLITFGGVILLIFIIGFVILATMGDRYHPVTSFDSPPKK